MAQRNQKWRLGWSCSGGAWAWTFWSLHGIWVGLGFGLQVPNIDPSILFIYKINTVYTVLYIKYVHFLNFILFEKQTKYKNLGAQANPAELRPYLKDLLIVLFVVILFTVNLFILIYFPILEANLLLFENITLTLKGRNWVSTRLLSLETIYVFLLLCTFFYPKNTRLLSLKVPYLILSYKKLTSIFGGDTLNNHIIHIIFIIFEASPLYLGLALWILPCWSTLNAVFSVISQFGLSLSIRSNSVFAAPFS